MIRLTDELIVFTIPEDVEWVNIRNNEFLKQINKELSIISNQLLTYGKYSTLFSKRIVQQYYNPDDFYLPKGKWKKVGFVSKSGELEGFDCEKYINPFYQKESIWYNYNAKSLDDAWNCTTKEESFISLLNSKGIFLEELNNQKLLILEKQ